MERACTREMCVEQGLMPDFNLRAKNTRRAVQPVSAAGTKEEQGSAEMSAVIRFGLFLLTPEDTTEGAASTRSISTLQGAAKTLFWVGAAVLSLIAFAG